jgi:hypothetical protein
MTLVLVALRFVGVAFAGKRSIRASTTATRGATPISSQRFPTIRG